MTVIATSTSATSSALSNQRKVDRCQNGVLWSMFWDGTSTTGTSMDFYYSTDNGATWAKGGEFGFAGTGTTYTPNGSLFIDLDDYAHAVYKDRHNGYIYYRRGTPNAARTAWTWGAAFAVVSSSDRNYPDLVAHRDGTGWVAHVVVSRPVTAAGNVYYQRVGISSGGVLSLASEADIGNGASNTAHKYPSISFHHTGDGKTVQGGTPHLFVSFSAGLDGAGYGIRLRKATYSGGAWTWGAEREIDSASFANAGRISSAFDGSRVVIAYADSASTGNIKVRERDAADTTTTTRTPTALSDGVVTGITTSHDASGNLFLGATGATSADPKALKYNRTAGTWGAWETLATTTTQPDTLTAARYGSSTIDFLHTSGAGSPYSVSYDAFSLNIAPNAPTIAAPADGAKIDRNSTQRFDWDFSDPDAGDSQSKYDLRYRVVGVSTWTDVTNSAPNTYHDFAAGTFVAGDYEWQVRTYDSQGAVGPYSASSFFTAATAPSEPTITDPLNGETISSSHTVVWSAPDQAAYQLRRVADNAGAADTSTVYYNSGEVTSATARSRSVEFETNNRYEHIQVRIKFDGLWSAWASIRVLVSFTPPPTPSVSLLADDDAGALIVTVTNPAPGGGEPAVNYNDVYVNDGAGEFRAATLVTPNSSWTYWLPKAQRDYAGNVRVVAVADNNTTASS